LSFFSVPTLQFSIRQEIHQSYKIVRSKSQKSLGKLAKQEPKGQCVCVTIKNYCKRITQRRTSCHIM